jgi:hypothetical protein
VEALVTVPAGVGGAPAGYMTHSICSTLYGQCGMISNIDHISQMIIDKIYGYI